MNRYLVRLGALGCALCMIAMGYLISLSPGLLAMIAAVFVSSFGTVAAFIVLVLTAFDLGGPT